MSQYDRAWIAARIPHQGSMCLLDSVVGYDAQHVHCLASSHRLPNNPLCREGQLAAACGIEYAAQAIAVHGALIAEAAKKPSPGYLASVRNTKLHVGRLDEIGSDLTVEAACVTSDSTTLLYDFTISGDGRMLLEGRAAIVLNASFVSLERGST